MRHLDSENILAALHLITAYNLAFAGSARFRALFGIGERLNKMIALNDTARIKIWAEQQKFRDGKEVAKSISTLENAIKEVDEERQRVKPKVDGESDLDNTLKPYFALFGTYAFSAILILGFEGDWSKLSTLVLLNAFLTVCLIFGIINSVCGFPMAKCMDDKSVTVIIVYILIASLGLIFAPSNWHSAAWWHQTLEQEAYEAWIKMYCVFIALSPTIITFCYLFRTSILFRIVNSQPSKRPVTLLYT